MSKGVYNLVSSILRTFFIKSRFVGFRESLREYSVCVANHLGSFGPVAIMSSLSSINARLHPWVIHEVTDLRKCAAYLRRDFVEKELKLRSVLAEGLSRILSRIWPSRCTPGVGTSTEPSSAASPICKREAAC